MENPGIENENGSGGGGGGRERIRRASNSKLPPASELPDADIRARVIKLLKRSTELVVSISKAEEELEQVEIELGAICEAYDLKGFRHGLNSYEYYGWKTRKTLSTTMLIANGVSAETIAASYVESKPFLMQKVNPFDVE
jgi:hypothetical protein